eukprot:m.292289 g.292289  ORF g.292289 m.292289 type:complete len:941 (-) comp19996_c0_seq2:228-3050(-)
MSPPRTGSGSGWRRGSAQEVPLNAEQTMRRQAIHDMMRDPDRASPILGTSPHRLSSIGKKLSVEDLSYNRVKLSPSLSRRSEDVSLSRTLSGQRRISGRISDTSTGTISSAMKTPLHSKFVAEVQDGTHAASAAELRQGTNASVSAVEARKIVFADERSSISATNLRQQSDGHTQGSDHVPGHALHTAGGAGETAPGCSGQPMVGSAFFKPVDGAPEKRPGASDGIAARSPITTTAKGNHPKTALGGNQSPSGGVAGRVRWSGVAHALIRGRQGGDTSSSSLSMSSTPSGSPQVRRRMTVAEMTLASLLAPLDRSKDGHVRKRDFSAILSRNGLTRDDPRLATLYTQLDLEDDSIPLPQLIRCAVQAGEIVPNALSGQMVIPDFSDFEKMVGEIFADKRKVTGGQVDNHIKPLAGVDETKYAMSITTVSGQRLSFGDADECFSCQALSQVVLYAEALREFGADYVHQHVGREPSGFDSHAMALKKIRQRDAPKRTAIPHNPFLTSGGIMCTSLLRPKEPESMRLAHFLKAWTSLCGKRVEFDPTVMVAERSSADRSIALAYMMKECHAFQGEDIDIDETLELYFSSRAVTVNTDMLATAAATLANGGTNPLTNVNVYDPDVCKNVMSLMLTAGMNDFSGEWTFSVGLPAKSATSGALMIVVPNVLGIAIWSPSVDDRGNSLRGVEIGKALVENFSFHHLDSHTMHSTKIDPCLSKQAQDTEAMFMLMYAATSGDSLKLEMLAKSGQNVNTADYDGRTALHVAAAEGHIDCVHVLLELGATESQDRWGNTAFNDAVRGENAEIIALLKSYGFSTVTTSLPETATLESFTPGADQSEPRADTSSFDANRSPETPADNEHTHELDTSVGTIRTPQAPSKVQPTVSSDVSDTPNSRPLTPQDTTSTNQASVVHTSAPESSTTEKLPVTSSKNDDDIENSALVFH